MRREIREAILADTHALLDPLDAYRKDRIRGTIMDATVDVCEDDITFAEGHQGAVLITFDEQAYYGCQDHIAEYDHEEKIRFELDIELGEMTLCFSDFVERETDDI